VDGEPLVETFAVGDAPNLSSQLAPRSSSASKALFIGISHFVDSKIADLPGAADEIDAIANVERGTRR
jgi:hypothetical protein